MIVAATPAPQRQATSHGAAEPSSSAPSPADTSLCLLNLSRSVRQTGGRRASARWLRQPRSLRNVLRSRRGAIGLAIAASVFAVSGVVALTTEGGLWYY